jgi:hypothetical protein
MNWREQALESLVSAYELLQSTGQSMVPRSKLRLAVQEVYACIEQVGFGYLQEISRLPLSPTYHYNLYLLLKLGVIHRDLRKILAECGRLRAKARHAPYQSPAQVDIELLAYFAIDLLRRVGVRVDPVALKVATAGGPKPGQVVLGTVRNISREVSCVRPPIVDLFAEVLTEDGDSAKLSHWSMSWELLRSETDIEDKGIKKDEVLELKVLRVLPPPSGLHVGKRQLEQPPSDWNATDPSGDTEVEVISLGDHEALVLTSQKYVGYVDETDILWTETPN